MQFRASVARRDIVLKLRQGPVTARLEQFIPVVLGPHAALVAGYDDLWLGIARQEYCASRSIRHPARKSQLGQMCKENVPASFLIGLMQDIKDRSEQAFTCRTNEPNVSAESKALRAQAGNQLPASCVRDETRGLITWQRKQQGL